MSDIREVELFYITLTSIPSHNLLSTHTVSFFRPASGEVASCLVVTLPQHTVVSHSSTPAISTEHLFLCVKNGILPWLSLKSPCFSMGLYAKIVAHSTWSLLYFTSLLFPHFSDQRETTKRRKPCSRSALNVAECVIPFHSLLSETNFPVITKSGKGQTLWKTRDRASNCIICLILKILFTKDGVPNMLLSCCHS